MYHVDIFNKGDSAFRAKSKDYEFVVDTKGNGVTPPDTLLASLGTCIGVYIRKYSEGARLKIDEFKISVDAEFSKEPPICFKEIKVNIEFKGLELQELRKKALIEFIKNCPIHNTFKSNPLIEVDIL
ncbi:MAG: OsmC family protein [Candidatus Omnitrophica bacterium]|nr:OsmC family protein [Candidatus Omnitrophota bacterium]